MDPLLKRALLVTLGFVLVLWLIELLKHLLGLPLYQLGVFPREMQGLWGILFAPLVHASWGHLISNSIVLLVLGVILLYGYPRSAWPVIALVYLGSGLGVWLFGRSSYHFGASGLTHGMMFFVFTVGILRRDKLSIALSLIVFLLYGGMVWSILPQQPGISYESHFFGAAIGVLCAFLFRHRDPLPPVKTYAWEGDEAGNKEAGDNVEDSPDKGSGSDVVKKISDCL